MKMQAKTNAFKDTIDSYLRTNNNQTLNRDHMWKIKGKKDEMKLTSKSKSEKQGHLSKKKKERETRSDNNKLE